MKATWGSQPFSTGFKKYEIHKDQDGLYSVFTWIDFNNHLGIVGWSEKHSIKEWSTAYNMALEHLGGSKV